MTTDGTYICNLCGDWKASCSLCRDVPYQRLIPNPQKPMTWRDKRELDQQSAAIKRAAFLGRFK